MAPKNPTQNKSQTITMRIDDKTRFQLDFCGRITGMSITTFVERAISEKAVTTDILNPLDGTELLNWTDFWDPDEGIRTITLLNSLEATGKYTSFEEDQLLTFIRQHWMYFSKSPALSELLRDNVNAIWGDIDHVLHAWLTTRKIAPNNGETNLQTLLDKANLKPFSEEVEQSPFPKEEDYSK